MIRSRSRKIAVAVVGRHVTPARDLDSGRPASTICYTGACRGPTGFSRGLLPVTTSAGSRDSRPSATASTSPVRRFPGLGIVRSRLSSERRNWTKRLSAVAAPPRTQSPSSLITPGTSYVLTPVTRTRVGVRARGPCAPAGTGSRQMKSRATSRFMCPLPSDRAETDGGMAPMGFRHTHEAAECPIRGPREQPRISCGRRTSLTPMLPGAP